MGRLVKPDKSPLGTEWSSRESSRMWRGMEFKMSIALLISSGEAKSSPSRTTWTLLNKDAALLKSANDSSSESSLAPRPWLAYASLIKPNALGDPSNSCLV